MKNVIAKMSIFCLLMVGTTALVSAQNKEPKFAADKLEVSFGNVDAKSGDNSRVFEFKNTGNAPLLVTNAIGSCGCTVPEWPKEPIMPGKTGNIKITYDIANRPGKIDKIVTITTNEVSATDASGASVYKTHQIKVTGDVKN